ncbi:glycosyl transferase family 1, partial [Fischerella thermalis CCMEE 5330]
SGSKEYEAEIKSLVTSSGIGDRVYFAGFLEGETKNLFIQGSDLFALTSHSENFAVVVLEALAAGVPVVVTPGVALASVVQQHQLGYVTQLDVSAIASTVEQYLNNPQQAKNMGKSAQKLIYDHYTWDKIAARMIHVYQAILSNHQGLSYV